MRVVGVLTTYAPEVLAAADERVASVADWLRTRGRQGAG
jgi:hypothetical protein